MDSPDKFRTTYRIGSTRLTSWYYATNAVYFVKICTHQPMSLFEIVIDNKIELTLLRHAVWDCWYTIPDHFPFVLLDEFIVVTNHIHGIIIIDKPMSLQSKNHFGKQSKNLASVVSAFKIWGKVSPTENTVFKFI